MSWKFRSRPAKRNERVTNDQLQVLLSLVDERSRPNLNALSLAMRDITPLALNIKQFGYELARTLAAALPQAEGAPAPAPLSSKLCTQADIESEWMAYWCGQLKVPVVFHRKLWEFAYVLQAIHGAGMLREGARGLGFGCGEEPIPSYLASTACLSPRPTCRPPTRKGAAGSRRTSMRGISIRHSRPIWSNAPPSTGW